MSVPQTGDLTDAERSALEGAIGAGLVEYGGPFEESDSVVTACRKLGLNPTDWHGNHMLSDLGEATG